MSKSTKQVETAAAEVVRQRAVLAEWETKQADAEREAAELENRAGTEILDTPDLEDEIDLRLASLKRRARSAAKAIEAQRPRVLAAESRYLAAQADAHEAPAREAEQALVKHNAETERILDLLRRHEGPYVSDLQYRRALASPGVTVVFESPAVVPTSHRLAAGATRLRRQVQVLRELAAGRDPEALIRTWKLNNSADAYPECVAGQDALVRAPHFLQQVEYARDTVAELEALPAQLEAEIAEWESRGRSGADGAEAAEVAIRRRRFRLGQIPEELAAARANLDALTVDQPAA